MTTAVVVLSCALFLSVIVAGLALVSAIHLHTSWLTLRARVAAQHRELVKVRAERDAGRHLCTGRVHQHPPPPAGSPAGAYPATVQFPATPPRYAAAAVPVPAPARPHRRAS